MDLSKIEEIIRQSAYEVRLSLAPGYLESVYSNALIFELQERGLNVQKELPIHVTYKNVVVGEFRADIVVEDAVIIELKSVTNLLPIHEAQLVNYLVATGKEVGFLINYGGEKFRIIKKTRIYSQPS